jgi:maltooligosyltrehalose trehalohydrolase
VRVTYDEDARWFAMQRGRVLVVCNLGSERAVVPVDGTPGAVLLQSEPGAKHAPGSVELDGESVLVVELAP